MQSSHNMPDSVVPRVPEIRARILHRRPEEKPNITSTITRTSFPIPLHAKDASDADFDGDVTSYPPMIEAIPIESKAPETRQPLIDMFYLQQPVQIYDLRENLDLNGLIGEIAGYSMEDHRLIVRIPGHDCQYAVLPENLLVLQNANLGT